MGRTEVKNDMSPSPNKDSITNSKNDINSKSSPSTVFEQSLPPRRSLYDDDDLDSDSFQDGLIDNKRDGVINNNNAAETLITLNGGKGTDKLIPDNIESSQGNYYMSNCQLTQSQPYDSSTYQNMLMQSMRNDPDKQLPPTFKAILINIIRTKVFRKIKFLTNVKLG